MIKVEQLKNENGYKPIEIKLTIETLEDLKEFKYRLGPMKSTVGQELFDFIKAEVDKFE